MTEALTAPRVEALAKRASYAAQAWSSETLRVYRQRFAAFRTWCEDRGVSALPASPETVADYMIALGQAGRARSTLRQVLAAVGHVHREADYPSPVHDRRVRSVLAGVLRAHGRPERPSDPLLPEDLAALVAQVQGGLTGVRDRALLLVGFAGGFRREELVALRVEHVIFGDEDMLVQLARSKTDREGAGHTRRICVGTHAHLCPVQALRAWLEQTRLQQGPIFRRLHRRGQVLDAGLDATHVYRLVTRCVERAREVDPARFAGRRITPHSLRAGLCTTAALAGKLESEIREHVGHRSPQTTARYIRSARLRKSQVTEGIGL